MSWAQWCDTYTEPLWKSALAPELNNPLTKGSCVPNQSQESPVLNSRKVTAMTRIKRAGPPVLIVAVVAGIFGYILACTKSRREHGSQAYAERGDIAQNTITAVS